MKIKYTIAPAPDHLLHKQEAGRMGNTRTMSDNCNAENELNLPAL